MVSFYFDKRRALATGIATCGTGVGAFAMAPFCTVLINMYGWRGAQWIVAGLVLNGVALGALYRPHAVVNRVKGKDKEVYVSKESSLSFKKILKSVRDSVDLSLLKNPVLDVYGMSCILVMTGRSEIDIFNIR